MNDQNLKDILQKYQPKAPPAPFAEFNKIELRLKSDRSQIRNQWFYVGGAMAASILAFWIFIQNPMDPSVTDSVVPIIALQSLGEDESDSIDLMMEEWPTMDVGEDFLELASN